MFVRELSLRDFRSYEQVTVAFDAGITALIGSNGQGKTNLVEAIVYAATLGSHRVATDAPLIRRGAAVAAIRVLVSHNDRDLELQLELDSTRPNRASLNRNPVKRPRDILGYLRAVVFAPEDLALVKGDPSDRRHFMDETLIALSPRLAGTRSDLDRVLKQRNALLKTAQHAARRSTAEVMHTLDAWDAQFARLSAQMALQRIALVEALSPHAVEHYAMLSDDRGPFAMRYECSLPEQPLDRDEEQWTEAYLAALAARRNDEIERGISLVGPHRDELSLQVRELPVKGYASHGEAWSAAVTLRLAAFELLRTDRAGGDPVLILDDVFAELDSRRRGRLAEFAGNAEQTIVTAAVPEDVPAALRGATFSLQNGEVSRV